MGLRAQPTGLTAWGESRQRTAGSRREVGKHLNVGIWGKAVVSQEVDGKRRGALSGRNSAPSWGGRLGLAHYWAESLASA